MGETCEPMSALNNPSPPVVFNIDLNQPHVWVTFRPGEVLGIYTERALAVLRCEREEDWIVAIPLDIDLPNPNVTLGTEEYPLQNKVNH